VLGNKVAEELFGNSENALKKTIRAESQRYKVIGVLEELGGSGLGGPDFDGYIYLPRTAARSFNPTNEIFAFYVQADSEKEVTALKTELEKRLLKRYDDEDFSVIEQTEFLEVIDTIFGVMNSVLIAIGSISLLVGGIGIMNIMYAAVTERTAEVGIRRSLGATKQDILSLFLSEALVISLIGGLLGLALAALLVLGIQPFFPASINTLSVFVALGVSSGIGIFFGVFPAAKAANRSPIEAIRYE